MTSRGLPGDYLHARRGQVRRVAKLWDPGRAGILPWDLGIKFFWSELSEGYVCVCIIYTYIYIYIMISTV